MNLRKKKQKTDGEKPKKKKEAPKEKKTKPKEKKKKTKKVELKKGQDDPRFPYKINVSVGADQSTGPGFYSVTIVRCTISSDDLAKAYEIGSAKLGFDFQKEICTTNLNCALSPDHFKKMASNGIPVLDDGTGDDQELDFELTLDSYRDIWLHIARLGNPLLNWAVAEFDALPIGGNGLFQDLVEQREVEQKETDTKKEKPEPGTTTSSGPD